MKIYSLFDKKAGIYYTPFYQDNDSCAVRILSDGVNSAGNAVYQVHPGDFDLYRHGDFDSKTGLAVDGAAVHICNLADLVDPTRKEEKIVFEEKIDEET